uniref:Uncharacterized protein n=1 Tax=Romanomermis culicivorax TaxID=13658 RepID=A0A915J9E8_ROMCU
MGRFELIVKMLFSGNNNKGSHLREAKIDQINVDIFALRKQFWNFIVNDGAQFHFRMQCANMDGYRHCSANCVHPLVVVRHRYVTSYPPVMPHGGQAYRLMGYRKRGVECSVDVQYSSGNSTYWNLELESRSFTKLNKNPALITDLLIPRGGYPNVNFNRGDRCAYHVGNSLYQDSHENFEQNSDYKEFLEFKKQKELQKQYQQFQQQAALQQPQPTQAITGLTQTLHQGQFTNQQPHKDYSSVDQRVNCPNVVLGRIFQMKAIADQTIVPVVQVLLPVVSSNEVYLLRDTDTLVEPKLWDKIYPEDSEGDPESISPANLINAFTTTSMAREAERKDQAQVPPDGNQGQVKEKESNQAKGLRKLKNFKLLYYYSKKEFLEKKMGIGTQNCQQAPKHEWVHTECHVKFGKPQEQQDNHFFFINYYNIKWVV